MNALRHIPRPMLWLLLAAAMAVRAAVPAGWMPVESDGGVRITLCGGEAGHIYTIGRDGRIHEETPDPSQSAAHQTCPFAVAAAPVVAPVLPVIVPLVLPALEVPQLPLAALLLPPAPRVRPPGRAPPATA